MTKNNLLSEKLNYIGESETPTHCMFPATTLNKSRHFEDTI